MLLLVRFMSLRSAGKRNRREAERNTDQAFRSIFALGKTMGEAAAYISCRNRSSKSPGGSLRSQEISSPQRLTVALLFFRINQLGEVFLPKDRSTTFHLR
jgi:hypothetical protein